MQKAQYGKILGLSWLANLWNMTTSPKSHILLLALPTQVHINPLVSELLDTNCDLLGNVPALADNGFQLMLDLNFDAAAFEAARRPDYTQLIEPDWYTCFIHQVKYVNGTWGPYFSVTFSIPELNDRLFTDGFPHKIDINHSKLNRLIDACGGDLDVGCMCHVYIDQKLGRQDRVLKNKAMRFKKVGG